MREEARRMIKAFSQNIPETLRGNKEVLELLSLNNAALLVVKGMKNKTPPTRKGLQKFAIH